MTAETVHPDTFYMSRCFVLAKKGIRNTASNPMVGAVLVCNGIIIGEGYHQKFGSPHAEINAINAVSTDNKHLIPKSTLYVSLEPCSHSGKTPPCAHRIVTEKISRVVFGCKDPNPLVAGKGIDYLRANNVAVDGPIMEKEAQDLIRKFVTNLKGLPYIILKWAQSEDLYFSAKDHQVWLSNKYTQILTHKWRSEVDGIMVGRNTVQIDDPSLDVRQYYGPNPMRILIDTHLKTDPSKKLLSDGKPTIVINSKIEQKDGQTHYIKVDDTSDLTNILKILFGLGITSLLVEGGAALLQSFINQGLWHEARVIRTKTKLGDGIKAPAVQGKLQEKMQVADDEILFITNPSMQP
ncbi:MAG: bifunctional diaminohydroxyphosphoribosylaminopyrimidine deaminase/5-amino-6-(5-phosphoribosylamino)uracil reductase RibD [Saprospiraceae bacterium]